MPKRLLDIFLSLLALAVLFLPGLVIVIILKLTGEKEAFYFQPRVGQHQQLFTCWKLVTMRTGSETTGTGAITIKNDPRVTPLGKFLRKTKINELPQLFNVLKGDMSLVGPRPLTPEGFGFYTPDIQDTIAKVKPGLTGIGSIVFRDEEQMLGQTDKPYEQVYREDISPRKGAFECWYVQHQSFWLDLKILWYTNLVVLFPGTGWEQSFIAKHDLHNAIVHSHTNQEHRQSGKRPDQLRVLFLNQYYWPDYAATAQILTDLCERLAEASHEVHVVCSRGEYQTGGNRAGKPPRREVRNGVHIRRLFASSFAKRSLLGRTIDYASFHLSAGLHCLLTGWRYDCIVSLTTPPLLGIYAIPFRKLLGVRTVTWVMDIHPDIGIAIGLSPANRPTTRFLKWLNGYSFRASSMNVVLGECMADYLRAKGVAENQLITIPVWGHDFPQHDPQAVVNLKESLGLAGKFVVMYSGNAGVIHTFSEVLETAKRLKENDRIAFLFVGGGVRFREIEAFRDEFKLSNIVTRPYFPREQIGVTHEMGDLHLVTLIETVKGLAVPSKLYGILAAGKPVVFVGPEACDTARTIERGACGYVVTPNEGADQLERVILELASDPIRCRDMGERGRRVYVRQFQPEVCCEQWQQLIEALCGHKKASEDTLRQVEGQSVSRA